MDRLPRRAEPSGARATITAIEILSDELGDQTEVRRAPLSELAFDPREGIAVSVADATGHTELLRHVIAAPRSLEVTDEPGVPAALMIEDDTGTKTLVRFSATAVRSDPGELRRNLRRTTVVARAGYRRIRPVAGADRVGIPG